MSGGIDLTGRWEAFLAYFGIGEMAVPECGVSIIFTATRQLDVRGGGMRLVSVVDRDTGEELIDAVPADFALP